MQLGSLTDTKYPFTNERDFNPELCCPHGMLGIENKGCARKEQQIVLCHTEGQKDFGVWKSLLG